MRRNRLLRAAACTLALSAAAQPAVAFWKATGAGSGSAPTATMPAGNAPTLSAAGQSVTVTWAQSTFAGARLGTYGLGGYTVTRYAQGSSAPVTPSSACDTTTTGATASLQCVEAGVPYGSWQYTVTPVLGSFTGAESAKSTAIALPPPAPSAVSVTSGGNVKSGTSCGVTSGTRFINNAGKAAVGVSATISAPQAGESVVFSATTPGSTPVTATVAAGSTTVSTTLDLSSLLDGTVTLTARTQDFSGNQSSTVGPSNTIVKDVVAGALSGVTYHDNTLSPDSLSGTSECGATITATENSPHAGNVYTTTVGAGGTFSGFAVDTLLLSAYNYSVTATDLAGNTGTATTVSGSDLL